VERGLSTVERRLSTVERRLSKLARRLSTLERRISTLAACGSSKEERRSFEVRVPTWTGTRHFFRR
jgi:hypothetical protein